MRVLNLTDFCTQLFYPRINSPPTLSMAEMQTLSYILAKRDFEIVKCIGSGGYAKVFQVHSSKYNKDFAAKVFGMSGPAAKIASFSSEISVLKSLLHQNIVLVYDYFSEKSLMIIILEYCEQGSIAGLIQDGVGIPSKCVRRMLDGIVHAFQYLHSENIAHRDIKPANILLDSYGRPKIADFGLSQKMEDTTGRVWRFGGSLPFLAPEILKRESYNPFPADVWSLGVTIYLLVTGNLPWPSKKDLTESIVKGEYTIPETVSPDLADVIRACLKVNPDERLTMNEIVELPYFQQTASATTMWTYSSEHHDYIIQPKPNGRWIEFSPARRSRPAYLANSLLVSQRVKTAKRRRFTTVGPPPNFD